MKIKFLSVIASFFLVSLAFTSCLDSNSAIEYGTDPTIHSFSTDTIKGINYPFTIDQLKGLIYNQDSLPVGTDLTKIPVTINASGAVLCADSAWVSTDSLNFTNPVKFTIYAEDGVTKKDYTVKFNVHQQDPDSLVWGKMTSSFSGGKITGEQKSVVFINSICTFSNGSVFSTSVLNGKVWVESTLAGLPSNVILSSIMNFNNRLYAVTGDGDVYFSMNATDWAKSSLSGNVKALIATYSDRLAGIYEQDGKNYFCISKDGSTWTNSKKEVYSDFPLSKISSTVYTTKTGIEKALMVGETTAVGDTVTVPWFSLDGLDWAPLTTDTEYSCPKLENISLIHYNDKFYVFGGKGQTGFEKFYSSEEGIVWKEVTKKVCFPADFKGRDNYSYVVPTDNSIWIMWSKSGNSDEVWRGKINRLGFNIQ